MRATRRWGFTVLALLPTLLIILLAEARLQWRQLRGYVHRNATGEVEVKIHRRSDDPQLVYELNPGGAADFHGSQVRINSTGFRDDEFPGPEAAVGERIMVLGDSVAFGLFVPRDKAFPQVLEKILVDRTPEGTPPPVVYNLGVTGYSTQQEMRVLRKWKERLQPDVIIWSYVLNDASEGGGQMWYFGPPRSELIEATSSALVRLKYRLEGRPFNAYRHGHMEAADEIRRHFAEMGRVNRDGPRVLLALCPVFSFQADGTYEYEDLHALIRGLAEENGIEFIDLRHAFRGRAGSKVSLDRLHPNSAGHAIIAETLASALSDPPTRE